MANMFDSWRCLKAPRPAPAEPCRHIFAPAFFTGPETKVSCTKCGYTLIVSASMFGQVHVSEAK